MKVFFRISTRIFHILDQNSLLFCQENVRSEQLCHSKIFFVKNIFPGDDFSCN